MNLSSDLNSFRERGQIPASVSKRFIRVLKPDERARLAKMLREQLDVALESDGTTENDCLSLCARILRVRKVRKERGELK